MGGEPASPGAAGAARDTVTIAKGLLTQSTLRQTLFDGFLRQPSWDMLLCLYVAFHERTSVTQPVLCALPGGPSGPPTRLLREMERHGLVIRREEAGPGGETLVEMTGEAAAAMEGLLRDLAEGVHMSEEGARRPNPRGRSR